MPTTSKKRDDPSSNFNHSSKSRGDVNSGYLSTSGMRHTVVKLWTARHLQTASAHQMKQHQIYRQILDVFCHLDVIRPPITSLVLSSGQTTSGSWNLRAILICCWITVATQVLRPGKVHKHWNSRVRLVRFLMTATMQTLSLWEIYK